MKNLLTGICLWAGTLAFAGVDNVVLTFSTKGPDRYADGTTVLDGEFYALCWTQKGHAFAGIDANGQPVDAAHNKILLKAPVAQGGRCPDIQFEIDETFYAQNGLKDGTLSVCLLDSRKFKSEGGVIVKDAGGNPVVASWGQSSGLVNGYGDTGAVVGSAKSSVELATASAGQKAAVPTTGRDLRIRDMKLVDGNVYVYVRGSLPSVRYGLKSGSEPGSLATEAQERYGAGAEQDLIIVTPQKAGAQFFSVETK